MEDEGQNSKPEKDTGTFSQAVQLKEPERTLAVSPGRSLYEGLAERAFTQKQFEILTEAVKEEMLDVLPTGEVYLAQIHYRRRLNIAFGVGGWGVRPVGQAVMKDNSLMREYALFVENRFVSQAAGEADYIPNNPRMSWATANEACKSNAIMRLCKDLGIASECWDRRFTEQFKEKNCVKVYRTGRHRNPWQWRLKNNPFDDEGEPPANGAQKPRQANQNTSAPSDNGSIIINKFASSCRQCEASIAPGDKVWYQRGTKGVLCVQCSVPTEQQPVGQGEIPF
jgi:hypothetical protein